MFLKEKNLYTSYYYSDIEARWNGKDLEFIAFPVLVIG